MKERANEMPKPVVTETAPEPFPDDGTPELAEMAARAEAAKAGDYSAWDSEDDTWEVQDIGLGDLIRQAIGTPQVFLFRGEKTARKPLSPEECKAKNLPEDSFEECQAFVFHDRQGFQFFAWKSYALAEGLEDAKVGQKVRLTYVGEREIKGTANRTKLWKIELGSVVDPSKE